MPEDLTCVLALDLEFVSAFGTLPFPFSLGWGHEGTGGAIWADKVLHPIPSYIPAPSGSVVCPTYEDNRLTELKVLSSF